jgi:hypothetical protein
VLFAIFRAGVAFASGLPANLARAFCKSVQANAPAAFVDMLRILDRPGIEFAVLVPVELNTVNRAPSSKSSERTRTSSARMASSSLRRLGFTKT